MSRHPNSSRARYGRAKTLDKIAEQKRSNALLDAAIDAYLHTLKAPNVPDPLLVLVAERTIDRMRFKGLHLKAVPVHELLINKFRFEPKYHVNYAITYLMVNRLKSAEAVLKKALTLFPEDPPILAYYGLVLKLIGKTSECVEPLEKGLATDHPDTKDSRLYFHLGDALSRVGRNDDAMKVYEKAVNFGLIRSKYQRSLYNVDRLEAKPWWTPEQTTYLEHFKKLENNWKKIRDEGMAALKISGSYLDEAESLRDVGDWKQFELFARGIKNKNNCNKVPFTCGLVSEFVAAKTCRRGQVKFSIMEPGTHVWPHCGPTNCRLRAHLGLVVPPGPYIRVAETTRTWVEGKVIIFDDSFEHEVWHNGTSFRLVLIVDVWHPGLTEEEKRSLSAI